jgi:hypothetical protein
MRSWNATIARSAVTAISISRPLSLSGTVTHGTRPLVHHPARARHEVAIGQRGVAGEAVKKLSALLETTAPLTTQSTNLTTKISEYKKQLDKLDIRMTDLLARYNKQFAAMESMVGQSKSLQTSLKSTFEGMMATYTNK